MKRFLILLLLIFPSVSIANEKSIWIEATGESSLGDMDTPKDVKERARRDAQSKAVEKAVGSFIKSHTLVSNNQIAEDLVYASVRGKVEKMEIIKEGWDGKDRNLYRVKLKALVGSVYPWHGQGISLKLSLSKNVLREGEATKIYYQSSNDCYVYIFSIAADGSVTLLLPNAKIKDNRILPGKAYEFPPADSLVRLQAMFLPGFKGAVAEEKIKIIATKNEEAIIPLGFQEGLLKVFDAKSTGMVNDLVKKLNQLEPTDWTDVTVIYKIVR